LLALTCLLVQLSSLPGQPGDVEVSVVDLVRQARSFLRTHNPQKAQVVLERAVARDPRSAEAWSLLGDSYAQLGSADKAKRSYETALKLDPASPNALYNLGVLQLNRNRFGEAAARLEAFRKLRPHDRGVLFPLAHCYFQLGRHEEAKQALVGAAGNSWEANLKAGQLLLAHSEDEAAIPPLEKALRIRPNADEVRLALATAESRLGRHQRVVESLEGHSNSIEPMYRFLLGSSLSNVGRHEEAIPLLEVAVREWPEDKPARLSLASAYVGAARATDALHVLRQAQFQWPEDAEVRSALARQLLRTGEPTAALGVLNTSAEGSRGAEDLELYANCYVALGQLEEAERFAQQAVDAGGGQESSLVALSNILQLQSRHPEVIALLERHRQTHAQSAPYLLTLGISYYSNGNYAEASRLFEVAASIDPGMAQAHYLQGSTMASLGMPELAVRHYEAAVRLVPDHPLYHLHLGLVLSILGKKDRAEEHLRRSVELNGSHAPARYELAKVYAESSRDDLAREQLEEAIKTDAQFESSYYLLSQIYMRLGRREDAGRMMKQFQSLQRQRHEEEQALKRLSTGGPKP
jgi:tetratricopeptide (TPR) repeat protein